MLIENKELIIFAPSLCVATLNCFRILYYYFYSINAEQFYGVPKFYFYDNLYVDYLVKIILFIITIIIFFFPQEIKSFLSRNKLSVLESLLYSSLFGVFAFVVSLIFFFSFLIDILKESEYLYFILYGCAIFGVITLCVYFLIFRNDSKEYLNNKQEINSNKVKHKSFFMPKTSDDIINIFSLVIGIIVIGMILLLMYHSLQFNPDNKKRYEIIEENDMECKVIIGYYKDLAILMDGKISWSDEKTKKYLKITKDEYKLESIKNKKLKYYKFNKIICENK